MKTLVFIVVQCLFNYNIIVASMPMVVTKRVKVKQIILFAKIVNWYFESKYQLNIFCIPVPKFWWRFCENKGKGAKPLYLPVVHSKHTSSYTGLHLLDLMQ